MRTGAVVEVDESRARAVVEAEHPWGRILSVEQIHQRDRGFQYDLFPVWRIRFDDEAGTYVHVGTREARVVRNTHRDRARTTRRGLHTFAKLHLLRIPGKGIYALLVAAAFAALTGILTGYWLSLQNSWRPRGE